VIADDVVLDVEGMESGYGEAKILHGVTMAVRKGTIVTVMGPNGSGKSTFVKTVVGIVRHAAGATQCRARDGTIVDITKFQPHQLAAMGVAYVPQLANVFADMSVMENLQLGALPLKGRPAEASARIEAVLEGFPVVRARLRERAGTLSGGQRQMLAMARALVPDPHLLLLDEPSAGLQPDVVDVVFDKIREFRNHGVSVLIVEQKARQSLAFSDYAYILDMGRNRYEGAGDEILHDRRSSTSTSAAGGSSSSRWPPSRSRSSAATIPTGSTRASRRDPAGPLRRPPDRPHGLHRRRRPGPAEPAPGP
jgi:ABC-type branched-subunit amino acid transport system ATPase component